MTYTIFVAGDLHIPSRATMLHPKFQQILESKKWDFIVLTGDYTTPKVLSWFQSFLKNKNNLIACKGNMDNFVLPEKPTFAIQGLTFGVYHGTDIHPRGDIHQLKTIAEELRVKILFNGHSHKKMLYIDDDHILLNPGTSSGASGGSSWAVDTAIITIELTETKMIIELLSISERGKITRESSVYNLE